VHFCTTHCPRRLVVQFGTVAVHNCITDADHGALMHLCTISPTQRS
jgi:hypothetical protein